MGTRSPSSWKGRGTQKGAGEREQVTLGEGDSAIQRGERGIDGGIARVKGCDEKRQSTTEDLTWGSRVPQGRLYTVKKGGMNMKRDGIKSHPKRKHTVRIPVPTR